MGDDQPRLQVGEDLAFERREFRARKAFNVIWAIVLVAAVLGVFGTGPLADSSTAEGDLGVDFERFTRFGAHTEIVVDPGGAAGATNIAIARSYLEDLTVDDVIPQPESVSSLADRVVYTFDLGGAGSSVKFFATPREIGLQKATLWGPDGDTVRFTQVVYP